MRRCLLIAGLVACTVVAAWAQTVSSGSVTSVAGGKITLALTDGGTLTFAASDLAPDVRIVLGGRPSQLTDIRVGARLSVLVGADFGIHAISDGPLAAPAAPKPPAKPPVAAPHPTPAQWNSPSINGKVQWWTGVVSERGTEGDGPQMKRSFVLTRPGGTETQTFRPDAKTKFYVLSDGKPVLATFDAITLNKTVSVALQDSQVLQATVLR
jgi:hypothetical protein